MSEIKSQRRYDINDEAVYVYFRETGGKLVYRYADVPNGKPIWLYDAEDTPLGRFDTADDAESAVGKYL